MELVYCRFSFLLIGMVLGNFIGPVFLQSIKSDDDLDPLNLMEQEKAKVSVMRTKFLDAPYNIQLSAFGHEFNLTLRRPETKIFSDNFQLNDETSWTDLWEIEKTIFVDYDVGAVLQVYVNSKGVFDITGYVRGYGVHSKNGQIYVTRPVKRSNPEQVDSLDMEPNITSIESETGNISDHLTNFTVDLNSDNDAEKRQEAVKTGVIEVFAVYDQRLKNDVTKRGLNVVSYIAIMFTAANLVYKSLTDPKLTLQLVGCLPLTNKEEEKLITDILVDINKMPAVLSKIIQDVDPGDSPNYEGYTSSDVVALITGRITIDPEIPNNNYGTVGIAKNIPGACTNDKATIVREYGAGYMGVHTLAHEIGHILGAYHDFEASVCPKSNFCPEATTKHCTGYVMDYDVAGVTTIFEFSKCSKYYIRRFSRAKLGSCLFENKFEALSASNELPGEKTSLKKQCEVAIKNSNIMQNFQNDETVKYTPQKPLLDKAKDCTKFQCPFERDDDKQFDYSITVYPLPGSPCQMNNEDGICMTGECKTT